ncbi:MAG: DUF4397 domain-containing protein [Chitinophagaceae bacterium]
MKKYFSIFFFAAVIFLLYIGCEKNEINLGGDSKVVDNSVAQLKVNYASLYANNRIVVIDINGTRVSPGIYGRTPFPGGGLNTYGTNYPMFFTVEPGENEVAIAMPYAQDSLHAGADSTVLFSTKVTLEAGKTYTLHISDTSTVTKTLLTEEDLTKADSGYNRYRVANLMPNVEAIDVYYGKSLTNVSSDTLIAGNIGYNTIGDYITLPISIGSRYWKVRVAGSSILSTNVLASYISTATYVNSRTFTIFALGYNGLTTAPRRPYISFLYIQ